MLRPALLAASALLPVPALLPLPALAQDAGVELPTVNVQATSGGSLTVPSESAARAAINLTPGGAEVVGDTAWANTPATTVKDMLDFVPGVFAQPKWGEDTRLSIRGSGVSRSSHLRGIQLFQDGIPLSSVDGGGDFQEIDPTAFQYVEVFKGANGYQFGANALGGAINFVTFTGRDASPFEGRVDVGSFGFYRLQASTGGAQGAFDGFVTGSWLTQDGFRDHSAGENTRGSANFGIQLNESLETRFYLNATNVNQQIPGSVSKTVALNSPQSANPTNVLLNYQRNIESVRLANKTTAILSDTTKIEGGVFYTNKDLNHPIFQVLNYNYEEYGAFTRLVDERSIGGFNNRLVAGINYGTGTTDAQRYVNTAGIAGKLAYWSNDDATTTTYYMEDHFYLTPAFALVGAFQYLSASLDRTAIYNATSGGNDYGLFLPKGGFVFEVAPGAQVYGNVSRSGEVPTFSELTNFVDPIIGNLQAQTATTIEVGTRGKAPTYSWDVSLYRSWVENELQCQDPGNTLGLTCTVVNLGSTIHQGLEAGFGVQVLKDLFTPGPITDSVWLNVAYTYSDFYFNNDPVWGNNRLPGIPPHYLRAELLYKHPSGFYAGPNVEWVPVAYYVDDANTLDTSPYALLNFRLGYDNGKGPSFYMDARNLLDVNYIASVSVTGRASANQALFEPGNGRSVTVGTRFTF
ncbi:TonB-dependent receptor family protein [Azorhizobium doebereinerae]|uniref:TonB-dependent receptor family protein n=1 Tax=Azorhizobium doebereinerae TaxID=281091 RepID=UPI00040FF64F|nr:TonB-dependent receptor [Azorhizobium doebereinerae]